MQLKSVQQIFNTWKSAKYFSNIVGVTTLNNKNIKKQKQKTGNIA